MSHLKCVTMLTQKSVQKGYFFLENCVELCVHKIGDKLGKIHTEWVILWNNVNKIISLKKTSQLFGVLLQRNPINVQRTKHSSSSI
mgnify:CR=1 FL=1